jgi:hypothetical protein
MWKADAERQPRARGDVAADSEIRAIQLAAGVLARVGIVLSPAVGAVLMSLSTAAKARSMRPAVHRDQGTIVLTQSQTRLLGPAGT